MIEDAEKLRELVEELAELPLMDRRAYISQIESANGKEAADQLRNALTDFWKLKG